MLQSSYTLAAETVVTRGPAWQGRDEDGGEGGLGLVLRSISSSANANINSPFLYSVMWADTDITETYSHSFVDPGSCQITPKNSDITRIDQETAYITTGTPAPVSTAQLPSTFQFPATLPVKLDDKKQHRLIELTERLISLHDDDEQNEFLRQSAKMAIERNDLDMQKTLEDMLSEAVNMLESRGKDRHERTNYVDDEKSPYPKSSILRFHGKRVPGAAVDKGDIVVRSPSNWPHGNQDGGEGRTGIVVTVDKSMYWVQWACGNQCNYQASNLKVIGRVKQINIGDEVERGPDWKAEYGDQDGGSGGRGIVTKFSSNGQGNEVDVLWRNNKRANYRWGSAYDLKIIHSDAARYLKIY